MLSMAATCRSADNRSGDRVLSARQAPLNSSISATSESIAGVIFREAISIMTPLYTHLHPFGGRQRLLEGCLTVPLEMSLVVAQGRNPSSALG